MSRTSVSIQLTPEEQKRVKQASRSTYLEENVLIKKWVLEGLARTRLDHACEAYRQGEMDISTASEYAEISSYEMMRELQKRGIEIVQFDQVLDGLESLINTFGASPEIRETLASYRTNPPDTA